MNKLGVHAFGREKGWNHEQSAGAIARRAETDYDLVEVSAMGMDEIDAAQTRSELAKHKFGCTFHVRHDGG